MPLYDYRCTTCDAVYEARRSMADADAPEVDARAGHHGAALTGPRRW